MFMDNYDLSNLLLLADCADTRERNPRLTDEQNKRATFSKRSTTTTTTEEAEQQQLPSTGDEQIPEQKGLANFDISLAPSILAPRIVDEPLVDEPEDPFAALAAYQSRTFDDDTQQLLEGNLGFLGDSNTSEAVLAEPDGNEVHELPEQPQGESDAPGIIIPESTTPDTVLHKCSGKRRASEPSSPIKESVDPHVDDSLRRSGKLTEKRQKPDSTETKLSLFPLGMKTRAVRLVKSTASQKNTEPSSLIKESVDPYVDDFLRRSGKLTEKRQKPDSTETKLSLFPLGIKTRAAALVKSTNSQKNTEQSPDKSLRNRVKKESEKWIVRCANDVRERYKCSYPNCGLAYTSISNLKSHIFNHIHISTYKCTYPECGDNRYFRDNTNLQRHLQLFHKKKKPHHCTLCDKRFGRSDSYKSHMFRVHDLKL